MFFGSETKDLGEICARDLGISSPEVVMKVIGIDKIFQSKMRGKWLKIEP